MRKSSSSSIPITAAEFFTLFFNELEKQDIPYAILHSYDGMPALIPSDVDFSVSAGALPSVRPIVERMAREAGWLFVKTIQHEAYGYQFVTINPHDFREFLQLDVCPHFMRDAHIYLTDEELLNGRRRCNGFFVPSPEAEFAYLLAKTLSKKKPLVGCLPRLRALWGQAPDACEARLERLLGIGSLEDLERGEAAALLREMKTLHPRQTKVRLLEGLRLLRRTWKPCGLSLAVLGPDGVGKSTLLHHLGEALAPLFRSQHLLHFRPGFFERKKPEGSMVSSPHAGAPRSTAASWLKLLYYGADYICGHFFQQLPARIRNSCVIFDRNVDDLLIDSTRYRVRNSRWLVRLIRLLLPSPDLTFILDAAPEVVHQRKPELPLDEIARQRAVMQELAAMGGHYRIINAEQPAPDVASEVCRQIAVFLASRELNR